MKLLALSLFLPTTHAALLSSTHPTCDEIKDEFDFDVFETQDFNLDPDDFSGIAPKCGPTFSFFHGFGSHAKIDLGQFPFILQASAKFFAAYATVTLRVGVIGVNVAAVLTLERPKGSTNFTEYEETDCTIKLPLGIECDCELDARDLGTCTGPIFGVNELPDEFFPDGRTDYENDAVKMLAFQNPFAPWLYNDSEE